MTRTHPSRRRLAPRAAAPLALAAAVALAAFGAPSPRAGDDAATAPPAAPTAEQVNAMVAAMNPVLPQHRRLASLEGTWHQTFELLMGPGAEPFVYACVSEQRVVVGDQWVRCDVRPATPDGFAFSGLYVYGYDVNKQRYVAFGVDSLGSYPVLMEGDFEPGTEVLRLDGTLPMPGVGEVPYIFRVDMTDPARVIYTNTVKGPDGSEFTNLTITAVRQAPRPPAPPATE